MNYLFEEKVQLIVRSMEIQMHGLNMKVICIALTVGKKHMEN